RSIPTITTALCLDSELGAPFNLCVLRVLCVVICFPYNLPMPVSPARAAAFDILRRLERESSYASELLHSATYEKLSTADHALTTELVMGVLRWRSLLDERVSQASSQPLKKLDLEILIALRLGLYQVLYLDRIPT